MARLKASFVFVAVVAVIVVLYLFHYTVRQPAAVQNTGSEEIFLPGHDVIDNLSYADAASLYHRYVNNIQYACPHMDRMGKLGDGGWELCVASLYRPHPPCLIYSFGINNDFSFDDDARAKLGCEIHCFDPSMGRPDHVHAEGVFFHNLGLAHFNGSSRNWKLLTLQAIRSELGHSKARVSVVKMDIEDMEWDAIPEMLGSGAMADVVQFVLEVHVMPVGLTHRVDPEYGRYTRGLHVLKMLYDHGFRIFFTHRNLGCQFLSKFGPERCGCHEIFTVRVKVK